MTGLGRILFALGFALLGALVLGRHVFALTWHPAPGAVAWRDVVGIVIGALMLAGGATLPTPRATRPAAIAIGTGILIQILVLIVPNIPRHPELLYESLGEQVVYIAGAWAVFSLSPPANGSTAKFSDVKAARIVFALALLPIGLSHVLAMNLTAPLVPSWLPWHVALADSTGAAHIAAGIGILAGIRLAATLEAAMMSLFTILVWIPQLAAAPEKLINWSEFFSSIAISGTAWVIAGSVRKTD